MKDLEEELEKKNVEKMIVQDHLIQIVFSEEGKAWKIVYYNIYSESVKRKWLGENQKIKNRHKRKKKMVLCLLHTSFSRGQRFK